MRKFLTRALGIAAVAVGFAIAGAGNAAAAVPGYEPYPSVTEQQAIWIEGGENAGKGAAQLVSAAVLGVPAAFMDYGEEIGDYGATFFPGIK